MQPQSIPLGKCPNCDNDLLGKYCYTCGQKKIDDKERTLKHFFSEVVHASFHIEHNILGNFWKLIIRPGFIVREYMEGRRKRYMSPFSVFAVINILYFVFSPLSDLSLQLYEQGQQYYGALAQTMIDSRLDNRGISFDAYAAVYDKTSASLSKILVIINVPLLALFITLVYLKKSAVFFSDHLIFALNFFAFLLLYSLLVIGLFHLFILADIKIASRVFQITFLAGSILYLVIAVRKVYQQNWFLTVVKSSFIILGFLLTHFIYRFILFMITFAST
jgi:hypothetical protein